MMTITKTGETYSVGGSIQIKNKEYTFSGNYTNNTTDRNAWVNVGELGNVSYNESGSRVSMNLDIEKDGPVSLAEFCDAMYNEIQEAINPVNE